MTPSSRVEVEVIEADLEDGTHVDTLFEILDAYARGPGGQNAPLGDEARENLGRGLLEHPMAFVLFGRVEGKIVGAAVCVFSFSTFAGRPSLNLDLTSQRGNDTLPARVLDSLLGGGSTAE